MRTKGVLKVQAALGEYINNLMKDFGSTLQAPTKDSMNGSEES